MKDEKTKRPLTQPQKEAIARRQRAKARKQHELRVQKHRIAAELALKVAEGSKGTTEYRSFQAQLATAHATLALEPAP